MLAVTLLVFTALLVICGILLLWAKKVDKPLIIGNNPQFKKFQRGYFAAYLMAMFADWLQGPYLYKLYSHFNYLEQQIAVMYVIGFASNIFFGIWIPLIADRYGRKKLCIFCTLVYAVSSVLPLTASYGLICLGRVLGGLASSVLFYAFEAWYVHEHVETHDFPKEWISVTFAKASLWNGMISVFTGVLLCAVVEWMNFAPLSPFILAAPVFIFTAFFIFSQWTENYSGQHVNLKKYYLKGLYQVHTDEKIFMVGAMEALFESVIYVFIFLWTPILDRGNFGLGMVFSCFMVCILIGSASFRILSSWRFQVTHLLVASAVLAFVACVLCVISTDPSHHYMLLSFGAYLMFEFSVGIYFSAMGFLRSRIIPEDLHTGIKNWFRIPMTIITSVVLMLLHDDIFQHGNRMIFVVCLGVLFTAILCGVRLAKLIRKDPEAIETSAVIESDHVHNIF